MPKMGESIMEGTVLSWLKQEGDIIEVDESILEVATDKVDTEVPATHGGMLKEILVKAGEMVPVGVPIAKIETDLVAEDTPQTKDTLPAASRGKTISPVKKQSAETNSPKRPVSGRFYSPLVMNIARKENIATSELERVCGTGRDGRVTKKDILAYVKNRTTSNQQTTQNTVAAGSISGEEEIIAMDRMRKIIAERMIDSKRVSAHVTSFVEADVTGIVHWRNRVKQLFKARRGEPITFTPIFIQAVVQAIKDYPMINVQVKEDNIIRKKAINVGVAVALPNGNLIVPVIHNADRYNLVELAGKMNDLVRRTRTYKLSADELQGGTYTVSNVGSFGNVMGTPIIMQPQVAILALGAVQKKPAVIETPNGDAIAIRNKMFLSHSYDHRIIDGALGGMFVRRVADYLERFDTAQEV